MFLFLTRMLHFVQKESSNFAGDLKLFKNSKNNGNVKIHPSIETDHLGW